MANVDFTEKRKALQTIDEIEKELKGKPYLLEFMRVALTWSSWQVRVMISRLSDGETK